MKAGSVHRFIKCIGFTLIIVSSCIITYILTQKPTGLKILAGNRGPIPVSIITVNQSKVELQVTDQYLIKVVVDQNDSWLFYSPTSKGDYFVGQNFLKAHHVWFDNLDYLLKQIELKDIETIIYYHEYCYLLFKKEDERLILPCSTTSVLGIDKAITYRDFLTKVEQYQSEQEDGIYGGEGIGK